MPELRQNFFTKEWVVIASERAKRPEQLIVHRAPQEPAVLLPKLSILPGKRKSDASRDPAPTRSRGHAEGADCPQQVRSVGPRGPARPGRPSLASDNPGVRRA